MTNGKKFSILTSLWACSMASAQSVQSPQKIWEPIAVVESARVREFSGIVASRRYPGVFWAHGDSGNEPRLVAFNISGKILSEVAVAGAPNTDWEDIAADDQGHLYIGDIGNNHAMFPARYVYRVLEPDPFDPPAEPIAVTQRWRFKYPDKKRFDCESLFWHQGSLHVIANVMPREANIYRLNEVREGRAELEPVHTPGLPFPTGADISSDGKHLVVSGYSGVWTFDITKDANRKVVLANRRVVHYPKGEGTIESVCFIGDDVIAMAENGKLYRLTEQDFKDQVRFARPPK